MVVPELRGELQLSDIGSNCPRFLAVVPVPEGTTAIVLLVPDEVQTLAKH